MRQSHWTSKSKGIPNGCHNKMKEGLFAKFSMCSNFSERIKPCALAAHMRLMTQMDLRAQIVHKSVTNFHAAGALMHTFKILTPTTCAGWQQKAGDSMTKLTIETSDPTLRDPMAKPLMETRGLMASFVPEWAMWHDLNCKNEGRCCGVTGRRHSQRVCLSWNAFAAVT